MGERSTLVDYFHLAFGGERSKAFRRARRRFIASMAAYSLVCYLLHVKDRHNGNMLLDRRGHIIHIDFGFVLSKAQLGRFLGDFEQAPFKLTAELIDVMGGRKSAGFRLYKLRMRQGFRALRRRYQALLMLVDVMNSTMQEELPCLSPTTLTELEARFCLQMDDAEADAYVGQLVKQAESSTSVKAYDFFNEKRYGIKK